MEKFLFLPKINKSEQEPYNPDILCQVEKSIIYMCHVPGQNKISKSTSRVWSRNLQLDILEIKKLNIHHIFCLMEDREFHKNGLGNYPAIVTSNEISISQYSIVDGKTPSLELIQQIIYDMRLCIQQGKNILIHCMAGMGRTGTIASCFLVHCGHSPQSAINFTQSRRKGTITRVNQQKFVEEYYSYLRSY